MLLVLMFTCRSVLINDVAKDRFRDFGIYDFILIDTIAEKQKCFYIVI